MNSPLSLFLIFSLALPLLFFSKEAVANSLEAQKQREFDYFALALQWPGTFCQRTHHCCSQNGCCRPELLTWFTIHGFWPDYYDGTWPSCCSRTEFDMKKVSSLLPTLDKYWPTLSCSSTSQCDGSRGSFWGHEEILNSAGFLASNSEKYPLGDIVATVKKVVGATPQVVCKKGSVQELRICFNKDFKVHNFSSKNQLAYIVNHLMVQITLDTTTTKHFSRIFGIGYMHPSLPPISDGPSMGNNGPSIYLNMDNNVPIDCINNSVTEDDTSNSRNSCPRNVRLPTYGPIVVEDVSAADAAAVTWFS